MAISLAALVLAAATVTVLAQSAPSAQVAQGGALYAEHCALCHGTDGKRGAGFQTPIWGPGTQIGKFANAQGLFEYNQMLMPFNDPTTLNDEQKMAITAYILANHGAMPRAGEVTAATLATIAIR